ncbi:hypothetical protein [Victivallis sp. Marseille-Q1083]|uniref:hypothetical protein n=1 Tax=Victivallis sp. Marseille-Q1083 TaxID=2717288 RepID=UPI00158ED7AB|nr:hypothetical protein [Victivallis sp. Marseille-Q1083]
MAAMAPKAIVFRRIADWRRARKVPVRPSKDSAISCKASVMTGLLRQSANRFIGYFSWLY